MDYREVMQKQFGIPQFDEFRASNGTFREAQKVRDQLSDILDSLHTVAQLQHDRALVDALQTQFDWIMIEKTKYEDYAYFYFKMNHFPEPYALPLQSSSCSDIHKQSVSSLSCHPPLLPGRSWSAHIDTNPKSHEPSESRVIHCARIHNPNPPSLDTYAEHTAAVADLDSRSVRSEQPINYNSHRRTRKDNTNFVTGTYVDRRKFSSPLGATVVRSGGPGRVQQSAEWSMLPPNCEPRQSVPMPLERRLFHRRPDRTSQSSHNDMCNGHRGAEMKEEVSMKRIDQLKEEDEEGFIFSSTYPSPSNADAPDDLHPTISQESTSCVNNIADNPSVPMLCSEEVLDDRTFEHDRDNVDCMHEEMGIVRMTMETRGRDEPSEGSYYKMNLHCEDKEPEPKNKKEEEKNDQEDHTDIKNENEIKNDNDHNNHNNNNNSNNNNNNNNNNDNNNDNNNNNNNNSDNSSDNNKTKSNDTVPSFGKTLMGFMSDVRSRIAQPFINNQNRASANTDVPPSPLLRKVNTALGLMQSRSLALNDEHDINKDVLDLSASTNVDGGCHQSNVDGRDKPTNINSDLNTSLPEVSDAKKMQPVKESLLTFITRSSNEKNDSAISTDSNANNYNSNASEDSLADIPPKLKRESIIVNCNEKQYNNNNNNTQEMNDSGNASVSGNSKSSGRSGKNEPLSFASVAGKQPNQCAKNKKALNVIAGANVAHPFWSGPSINNSGSLNTESCPNDNNTEKFSPGEDPNGGIKSISRTRPRLTQETLDAIFPGTFVKSLPSIDGVKLQYMTEIQTNVIQDLVDTNHNPLSNMCHVITSAAGTGKTTMALILALYDLYSHEKRFKSQQFRFNRTSRNNYAYDDSETLKDQNNVVYIFIVVPQTSRIESIVNWLEQAHGVCNFRVHYATRNRAFPELYRLQKGQHLFVGTPNSFCPLLSDPNSQQQILRHLHCLIMLQAETLFCWKHPNFTTALQQILNVQDTSTTTTSGRPTLQAQRSNGYMINNNNNLNQCNAKILIFSNTWCDVLERDLMKLVGKEGRAAPLIKNFSRQQVIHWHMECNDQAEKFLLLHQLCTRNPYEKALIFVKFFAKAQSLQSVLNQNEMALYDYNSCEDLNKLLAQIRQKKVRGLLCADKQRGLHDLWKFECNVIINYDICSPTMYMKRVASCGVENEPVHVITLLAKDDREIAEYKSLIKQLKMESNVLTLDRKASI